MEFLSPGVNPQSRAEKIAYLCNRVAGANGEEEKTMHRYRVLRSPKSALRFSGCVNYRRVPEPIHLMALVINREVTLGFTVRESAE